jgi:hypothetical protein
MKKKHFDNYLKSFELKELFNELGWANFDNALPVSVDDTTYKLTGIAEKQGFAIMLCPPQAGGKAPVSSVRKQIENRVTKTYFEHLIIYTDAKQTQQIWQLAIKEENKPKQVREVSWYSHQDTTVLFQRLKNLFFTLDEEEKITIVDVKQRISENFAKNTEQVTKKFYDSFKKQHTIFLDFIKGIDDKLADKENENKQWYASLMLNRLMFCYFIQKKGFLNRDVHYLQNKLKACGEVAGDDKFYGFYRSFLLELFHDGLGMPETKRKGEVPIDLGKIPYLNGGLFDVHELELQFTKIIISDDAFKSIFDFFDKWNWHLDNSIMATGKDINPDVIGYIFEKYINDRAAMGAYYTKEDITDYIGKNTIIPYLFDETERKYKDGFKPDAALWRVLQKSEDTYIYNAVKHGVPHTGDLYSDLPPDVQEGLLPEMEDKLVTAKTKEHLWQKRKSWNTKATEDIGLPTEIYREVIERRKRYSEIKEKITNGEIHHINDFITYNLDIRQFAQDIIETTEDVTFLKHFYTAITQVTILDPTCGSGAFLFAALNILEPLYEACIIRMEELVEEQPACQKLFGDILVDIRSDKHPSLQYFIYKSIILQNLYGVDIMKEAVEIAKLRLFLKLVATVDVDVTKPNYGLEPLPDVDFNIRAGNTLVGFATEAELTKAVQGDMHGQLRMGYEAELVAIQEECMLVSKAYGHFQNSQVVNDQGSENFKEAKKLLTKQLKTLNGKLNENLAKTYGIDKYEDIGGNKQLFRNDDMLPQVTKQYHTWLSTHQPFHWFAEFYSIVAAKGGFDVIIGNPPYLEMRQISYDINSLATRDSNAIHSMCIERSDQLLNINGSMSMILPLSLICTQRMTLVQEIIEKNRATWYSNFSWRPGKLFDQVNRALTIFNTVKSAKQVSYSTGYQKWNAEHRQFVFPTLSFTEHSENRNSFWFPKKSSTIEQNLLLKILESKSSISDYKGKSSKKVYYRTTGGLYWKVFTDFSPKFSVNGSVGKSSRETSFSLIGKQNNIQAVGLLSSGTFWWWYTLTSNLRDLNPSDITGFKFPQLLFENNIIRDVSSKYISEIKANSSMLQRVQKNKGLTETQSFKIVKSKQTIDEIDTVLAEHYQFTEAELDFIINYDIKYRMGKALYGETADDEDE